MFLKALANLSNEYQTKYHNVMKQLVKRYITRKQQRNLNSGVTEDDINEIKQDISGLRYQNFILNQKIQNR
jgi:hypothetical protein